MILNTTEVTEIHVVLMKVTLKVLDALSKHKKSKNRNQLIEGVKINHSCSIWTTMCQIKTALI